MRRLWLVVPAMCVALTTALAKPSAPIFAQGAAIWNVRGTDLGGFQGHAADGAPNSVSFVPDNQFPYPPGGGLKLDYTGSRGFNTAITTGVIPPAQWDSVVSIAADIYVPPQVTITRLGLGIQIDGPPASPTDVPVHLLGVRGGWNHTSWPVHPGQLTGRHTFGFVLDTDEAMPAPLIVAGLKAVTPELNV